MAHVSRPWATVSGFLSTALVACAAQPSSAPDPTDPVVYDASATTKDAVGIAKWGFAVDDADGASVFHGYDERNTRVVEIRQKLDIADVLTKHFVMTMTGSAAKGTERIDYVVEANEDGSEITYAQNVLENTFAEGSPGARILARLAPDAAASTSSEPTAEPATPAQILGQNIRPLTTSLLSQKPSDLILCCSELTRGAAASSADAAGVCLLQKTNVQVTPGATADNATGKAAPQDVEVDLSGGLAPRALDTDLNNMPRVDSPWAGPYNIVDNHCHNAAALNSSSTDGYIGCGAASSTTTTAGHTINWGPDPSRKGTRGAFCAYDPQADGGTALTKSVCCWQGSAGSNGAPLLSSSQAQGCVTQLCDGQANFRSATPPQAFAAGSTPPLPTDCPGSTGSLSACNSCCTSQANHVGNLFTEAQDKSQIRDYRTRCATACADKNAAQKPTGCLGKVLNARGNASSANNQCRSTRTK